MKKRAAPDGSFGSN